MHFILFSKRIISENGFNDIEHYMFEDHEMIRRAATECMCNLAMCEDVSVLQKFKSCYHKAWTICYFSRKLRIVKIKKRFEFFNVKRLRYFFKKF